MKDRFFALIVVVLALWSCGTLSQESKLESPPVGYQMKSFRVTSPDGCTGADSCAVFEISYPQFSGIDSAAAGKIRRMIELTFSMGDPEAEDKSIEQVANEFVSNYRQFKEEMPDLNQGWYYHGNALVNVLLDTLISISLEESYYTGGAHGGSGKYFINVNPKTGSEYRLDDFFKPGYREAITAEGEKVFRKERELTDTANLQENYFEFPDNIFQLNGNFGFTDAGIIFFFNNYEIAPYAAGPTEVLITFDKIKSWLRKEPAPKA